MEIKMLLGEKEKRLLMEIKKRYSTRQSTSSEKSELLDDVLSLLSIIDKLETVYG